MVKQYLQVFALSIGGFMVLNVLVSSMGSVSRLPDDARLVGLAFFALPLAVSVFFAYIVFRFANNLDIDENSRADSAFLIGGLKLFGVYLLIEGIRSFLAASNAGMAIYTERATDPTAMYYAIGRGMLYLVFSYVLVRKTSWLSNHLLKED